jgi:hypothetical protein
MQSTAVVTLRALVMLVCLVVVPLAAIFGSSLPQAFNSLVEGRGLPSFAGTARATDDARSRGGDAPVFASSSETPPHDEPPPPARRTDGTGTLWAPGAVPPAMDRSMAEAAPQAEMARSSPPGAQPMQAGQSAPRDPRMAGEDFQQIEHRLRELGATYYLLETWGNAGQMYRFHCKVSLAANASQSQNFDATDADPLRAMHKVREQVEQYRLGSAP